MTIEQYDDSFVGKYVIKKIVLEPHHHHHQQQQQLQKRKVFQRDFDKSQKL